MKETKSFGHANKQIDCERIIKRKDPLLKKSGSPPISWEEANTLAWCQSVLALSLD